MVKAFLSINVDKRLFTLNFVQTIYVSNYVILEDELWAVLETR